MKDTDCVLTEEGARAKINDTTTKQTQPLTVTGGSNCTKGEVIIFSVLHSPFLSVLVRPTVSGSSSRLDYTSLLLDAGQSNSTQLRLRVLGESSFTAESFIIKSPGWAPVIDRPHESPCASGRRYSNYSCRVIMAGIVRNNPSVVFSTKLSTPQPWAQTYRS